jgi:hypothetical protein
MSTERDVHPGYLSTSKYAKPGAQARNERKLTTHEVGEEIRIYYGSCQTILTENLGMMHVSAKFIP